MMMIVLGVRKNVMVTSNIQLVLVVAITKTMAIQAVLRLVTQIIIQMLIWTTLGVTLSHQLMVSKVIVNNAINKLTCFLGTFVVYLPTNSGLDTIYYPMVLH